jgi:hypothetical protein
MERAVRLVIGTAMVTAMAMVAVLATGCDAAARQPHAASGSHPAVLAAQIGVWRAQGWLTDGVEAQPFEAAWKCKPAGAVNECKWRMMSRNRLLGAERFEPALGGFMYTLAPDGPGKMLGRWEFAVDGERGVGVNEVHIVSPREWRQQTAIDIGGKRVFEVSLTHRRVR